MGFVILASMKIYNLNTIILTGFIGVLIIGSLESGIVALGLSGFYVKFINGLMITVAVSIYAIIQRKKT